MSRKWIGILAILSMLFGSIVVATDIYTIAVDKQENTMIIALLNFTRVNGWGEWKAVVVWIFPLIMGFFTFTHVVWGWRRVEPSTISAHLHRLPGGES